MFKVGQKVVCKNVGAFATSAPHGIEKGKIYTITAISKCICGRTLLHLDGVIEMKRWCGYLDKPNGCRNGFYSYRFKPVKYELISNMEIIKEIITERSDVPVKEPVF